MSALTDLFFQVWTLTCSKPVWVFCAVITIISLVRLLIRCIDFFWDDFIVLKGITRYFRVLKSFQNKRGVCDPASILETHSRLRPNKLFLLFEDQKFTFSKTNSKANEYAHALQKLGVTKEQKLALLMNNKPELLFLHYGCMKLAVPLVFLNTGLRTKSLMHCLRNVNAKNLLVDGEPELLGLLDEMAHELQAQGIRVFVYGNSNKYKKFCDALVGVKSSNPDLSVRKGVTNDDDLVYMFTSGTTGLPKAVKITYPRWAKYPAMLFVFGFKEDEIMYCPLPLFHGSSLLGFAGGALFTGTTFAFANKFSKTHFWEDCVAHNATVIQYIGETCRYLLRASPSDYEHKHRVRMAIGNGLRKDIWHKVQTRFNIPQMREFYAATEGNVYFVNLRNKFGSCGKITPLRKLVGPSQVHFVEYDYAEQTVVRGSNGLCQCVPRGIAGLLVAEITKMAPFEGYTDRAQTDQKILRDVVVKGDAYFNTGDMLLWDTDNYVYFEDRIGDSFRWKGENVSTVEIGNLLNDLDLILDCTVYGVAIPGMDGKCGMAAIVLASGNKPTTGELKDIYHHCTSNIPVYARPVFIRFVSRILLTETYKHQKYTLQTEGFDVHKVADVYVINKSLETYVPLTSELTDDIINGSWQI